MSGFLSILMIGFQIYIASALIYCVAFIILLFAVSFKLGRLGLEDQMTLQNLLNSRADQPTKSIWWYLAFGFVPVIRIIILILLAILAFNTSYFIEWMDKQYQEIEDRKL